MVDFIRVLETCYKNFRLLRDRHGWNAVGGLRGAILLSSVDPGAEFSAFLDRTRTLLGLQSGEIIRAFAKMQRRERHCSHQNQEDGPYAENAARTAGGFLERRQRRCGTLLFAWRCVVFRFAFCLRSRLGRRLRLRCLKLGDRFYLQSRDRFVECAPLILDDLFRHRRLYRSKLVEKRLASEFIHRLTPLGR